MTLPSQHNGPHERTALKEWAVLVEAMARGDIVAMVRKGGIREQRAGFSVHHSRFLLYPTFFHEKVGELALRFRARLDATHTDRPTPGRLRLGHVAEVLAVWRVEDLSLLTAIEPLHGLDGAAVASRFHYKNKPGVSVVAVRVLTLPRVTDVPEARRYGGCVSWVELDEPVDVAGAAPALGDAPLAAHVRTLRRALGEPVDPAA